MKLSDKMDFSKRVQIVYLKADKIFINKCTDFTDVFLSKLAIELFKYIKINNHIIKLVIINNLFIALFIAWI